MRDRVHMPRPWSPYLQELAPAAVTEGFRVALLDGFDIVDPYVLEIPEVLVGSLRR